MRLQPARQPDRQRGISLLEILITVVLVSIGFLAAAKMQIQGSRFSQGSYHSSQAYFMMSDMMDRLRANQEGVELGAYDNIRTSPGVSDPGCQQIECTPAQVAAQDLFDLSQYFYNLKGVASFTPLLPSSDNIEAFGEVTPVGDGKYVMKIVWAEKIGYANVPQVLSIEFVP